MGMGKGVKPGLGHGGIICVLQTQFFFFFFFFFLYSFLAVKHVLESIWHHINVKPAYI